MTEPDIPPETPRATNAPVVRRPRQGLPTPLLAGVAAPASALDAKSFFEQQERASGN